MESVLRKEVQEFIRVCERFVEFSHRHHGLTNKEREAVNVYVLHALYERVISSQPKHDKEKAA